MKPDTSGDVIADGRVALNALFKDVVQEALLSCPHADLFKDAVSRSQAPDYFEFVAPRDEMYLSKVLSKARSRAYNSTEEFLRDLQRIIANAVAYNSPGCGRYGYEPVIKWAKDLMLACVEKLEAHAAATAPEPQPESNTRGRSIQMKQENASDHHKRHASDEEHSPSSSLCNLDALVAACELATEQDGGLKEEDHEECDEEIEDASPTQGGTCNLVTDTLPKYRRHKSKVFIRPNKVVYLPTTFMEEHFNTTSLPVNCEMLVEADNKLQPERHTVTIKSVPRQGLSTMYCMTNVMKFQQQYLNWQILSWTKIDNHHIKIHLQSTGNSCPPPAPPPVNTPASRHSSLKDELPELPELIIGGKPGAIKTGAKCQESAKVRKNSVGSPRAAAAGNAQTCATAPRTTRTSAQDTRPTAAPAPAEPPAPAPLERQPSKIIYHNPPKPTVRQQQQLHMAQQVAQHAQHLRHQEHHTSPELPHEAEPQPPSSQVAGGRHYHHYHAPQSAVQPITPRGVIQGTARPGILLNLQIQQALENQKAAIASSGLRNSGELCTARSLKRSDSGTESVEEHRREAPGSRAAAGGSATTGTPTPTTSGSSSGANSSDGAGAKGNAKNLRYKKEKPGLRSAALELDDGPAVLTASNPNAVGQHLSAFKRCKVDGAGQVNSMMMPYGHLAHVMGAGSSGMPGVGSAMYSAALQPPMAAFSAMMGLPLGANTFQLTVPQVSGGMSSQTAAAAAAATAYMMAASAAARTFTQHTF